MRPRNLPLFPALAAIAACARATPDSPALNASATAAAPTSAPAATASKSQIEPTRLEQIAREFFDWGTVQEEAERAMTSCTQYTIPPNGDVVASGSTDDETHGGKLFLAFARYREAY